MIRRLLLHLLAPLSLAFAALADEPAKSEAATAFDKLKQLDGTWTGGVGQPDGDAAKVIYKVTAGGSVVMETLFPGTDHEMISMYHLEQGELIATHYCAMGNQPRMKLSKATPTEFTFDFVGGVGIDPEKSAHIHGGTITLRPDGKMEALWRVFRGGKEIAQNKFFLQRESGK
jgi:hypothetical protein